MQNKILILDFGSQYTQLIARVVRELNVYCEIIPYHKNIDFTPGLKGIILSGSPCSVNEKEAPVVNIPGLIEKCRYWVFVMGHNSVPNYMAGW